MSFIIVLLFIFMAVVFLTAWALTPGAEWIKSTKTVTPWYAVPLFYLMAPAMGLVDIILCTVAAIKDWARAHENVRAEFIRERKAMKAKARAQGGALSEADFNGGELSEVNDD